MEKNKLFKSMKVVDSVSDNKKTDLIAIKVDIHKETVRTRFRALDFSINCMFVFLSDIFVYNKELEYKWIIYNSSQIDNKLYNNGLKDLQNKILWVEGIYINKTFKGNYVLWLRKIDKNA